ncbi:xanthine dehydrogenase family protein subunit M [Rhodobacteraceae bacterium RKSG542]|uniref:FAD binding domain-containing protein n=1 Tax=Pseudovibrio flavus TaxID=2529854 RepID=UPI0012BBBC9C|nr:xanthine dehydrogenase family protein subunit M [Pseudovibrio flavus]MTI17737.1 xanthine dehydrogenase family protein subunit M [Pseudovibrio flavus]
MYETAYARPRTLEEAVELLQSDEDAKCLAGGMTYVPTLKQRLAMPSLLVDLSRLLSRDIAVADGFLTIGAGARHVDVQRSQIVRETLPALAELAGLIGDPMVRNRGTIGGSLSNNDPAADYPSAALALDAQITTTKQQYAAADFLSGMFETLLDDDEIVTHVRFKIPVCAAYSKFASKASGYAVAGAFVARFDDDVRVAITGAGPCVFRADQLEEALKGDFNVWALKGKTIEPEGLLSDMHADAEYRAALAVEMTKRAVHQITGA